MKVTVLAFASARDAIGQREIQIELAKGADLTVLRKTLVARYPALEPQWDGLALAVDGILAGSKQELAEGVEVALLPPVSGGERETAPRIELVRVPIDGEETLRRLTNSGTGAGLVFAGVVRANSRGKAVTKLEYDGYEPMALAALERIRSSLERRLQGLELAIVHRLGDVPAGETSVVIAAASPHRAAAFEACREALERLKHEVPIWKREHYADGTSEWREEERLAPAAAK